MLDGAVDVDHDLGLHRVVVHEIDEIVFGDRDERLGLTPREGNQEYPVCGPGETVKQGQSTFSTRSPSRIY